MAISLSLVLLLGIAVWLLYRYAGLKFWHAVICVLFGFFLATTTAAQRSATWSAASSPPFPASTDPAAPVRHDLRRFN